MKEWTRSSEYLVARIIVVVNFKNEETDEYLFGGKRVGLSLWRTVYKVAVPSAAGEAFCAYRDVSGEQMRFQIREKNEPSTVSVRMKPIKSVASIEASRFSKAGV